MILLKSIAVSFTAGAIISVILLTFGFEMMSLITLLATIIAVVIAYNLITYKLMSRISLNIQRKLAVGFLLPVLFVNSSILFMEVQGRQNIVISTTLIILTILAVVFSPVVSRTITKPLNKLRDAVNAICEGDFNVKVKVKSKDEIGELASSFGRLARDMKKSRVGLDGYSKELEKKMGRITGELEKAKKDLESKIDELERFNKLAVSREVKMAELKRRIEELENEE